MNTLPCGKRTTVLRDQKAIHFSCGWNLPILITQMSFMEDVFQANQSLQCRNDKVILTWKSRVLIWLSSCQAELTRHLFHLRALAWFGWQPSRALSRRVLPLHVLLGCEGTHQYSFHLDCPVKKTTVTKEVTACRAGTGEPALSKVGAKDTGLAHVLSRHFLRGLSWLRQHVCSATQRRAHCPLPAL